MADSDIALTLTGGMDSRLILAALLRAGLKPKCLTFGNHAAIDVLLSKHIASDFNLEHYTPASITPTSEWYYKWVTETIKIDAGNSHLHRAHRTAAIAEYVKRNPVKLLFTGHMGGEGLRGLSYNNYFASNFYEGVMEHRGSIEELFRDTLMRYFVQDIHIDYSKYREIINNLSWIKQDSKEVNKLFFIYNLLGNTHHAQDIRLYNHYVPKVVPVYLQREYLETLFSSEYNFISKDRAILSRLNNPKVYCKVIEYLYPKLLDYPLANRFTPREYMKGLYYYVPVKIYRSYIRKVSYPPTFTYGEWYLDFVREHSANISDYIWQFYDKDKYMRALREDIHQQSEGYWHKFSNPIYFDLVDKITNV
ncbi:MAG: hypothetical protein R3Y15_01415 [Rikenellaceae bacterium]